jgi:hypothetical protein
MPILNYTTEVPADRTVAEIQRTLARAGAGSVRIDYDQGEPAAVSFLLMLGGQPAPFRLPSNWQGVWAIIRKDTTVPRRLRTEAQAQRIAWRVVKDWVEAQLALIQSGQASLAQLFLPHAVRADGRTLFEVVAADPHLLLGQGGDPPP